MNAYWIWIPLTLIYNCLITWASVKYCHASFIKMYIALASLSLIPTWTIAAYFSKNLIFDSLLYDAILVLSSPIVFYLLGQGTHMTPLSWVGK